LSNNDIVDVVKEKKKKEFGFNLLHSGGRWLGVAREWMKRKAFDGESVTWGTDESLNLRTLHVVDIEQFSADIAHATLEEFVLNLATTKEIAALKVYTNPNNWTQENGHMIFKPIEGLHFYMQPQYGYDLIS